jgi:hypothetical protein
MTTFTLQDLTPSIETPEEKEAMDTLSTQQESNAQAVATAMDGYIGIGKTAVLETIQGATGAQYTPIDLTQFHKPLEEIQRTPTVQQLAQQLTESFALLIKAITELQGEDKQPVSSSTGGDTDLRECVGEVLRQADWFSDQLSEVVSDKVDDMDNSYEIERGVENWFDNFSLEDHVDIYSMVETAVNDKIDDVVEDKLADVVEEKLNELLQGKNISISFN